MKKHAAPLIIALIFIGGCSDNPTEIKIVTPPVSAVVQEFIEEEELPHLQTPEQMILLREIEFFYCKFGEGEDCPSGCIYNGAIGLRYGDRIGWLKFHDFNQEFPPTNRFFDFVAEDTEFFHFNMWLFLIQSDCRYCFDALIYSLASDLDPPRQTFISLVGILYSSVQIEVAQNLVENPIVGEDHEILGLLAGLPVFGGDAYWQIRERAQELLDDLN